MLELHFDVDALTAERWLVTVFDEQLPFATSRALNRLAREFQKDQRDHMRGVFTIRRKAFLRNSVKIKPWATKHRLAVRIAIDSPRGRSDIFGKFETQRRKGPFRGRSVAVPSDHVPRTPTGVIRNAWRPRALLDGGGQHGEGRVIRSRGDVFRGGRRTFMVRRPGGRGTIFERTSSGLRVLYQLVPQVPIEPELRFTRNAKRTASRGWTDAMTDEFNNAVRTARVRPAGLPRALRGLAAAA